MLGIFAFAYVSIISCTTILVLYSVPVGITHVAAEQEYKIQTSRFDTGCSDPQAADVCFAVQDDRGTIGRAPAGATRHAGKPLISHDAGEAPAVGGESARVIRILQNPFNFACEIRPFGAVSVIWTGFALSVPSERLQRAIPSRFTLFLLRGVGRSAVQTRRKPESLSFCKDSAADRSLLWGMRRFPDRIFVLG
jgi:hypothetical protein